MAQYQHLPIYRITYELLQKSVLTIKEFPRVFIFTIGQQLQETIVGLVVLIYKANTAKAECLIGGSQNSSGHGLMERAISISGWAQLGSSNLFRRTGSTASLLPKR